MGAGDALILDRYRLNAHLGRGSIADAYRATDQRLGETVVVKIAAPGGSDTPSRHPDFAVAMQAEVRRRIARTLPITHPHLLGLRDASVDGKRVVIVLPFVAGTPLSARLQREGRLPPATVAPILRSLAGALDYLHTRSIYGLDLGPQHCFLAGDGGADLIADLPSEYILGCLPTTGPVSSPAFTSYPLIDGATSPAADRYALGCLIALLLTGALPDRSASVLPGAAARDGAVTPSVRAVLERALAGKPSARYPTCRALSAAFDEAIGQHLPPG
jgi:serine/threonine-protein kinase